MKVRKQLKLPYAHPKLVSILFFNMKMLFTYLVHSRDDSNCGRVDYDSLTEQSLMEILFGDVLNISAWQDDEGAFLDIELWPLIQMHGDVVRKINIDNSAEGSRAFFGDWSDEDDDDTDDVNIGPGGTIDLRWIPRWVVVFEICCIEVSGTVETAMLPPKLIIFDISGNKFAGTFSIGHLPRELKIVYIYENQLEGKLEMDRLPMTIGTFNANSNNFSGSVDLQHLPNRMKYLSLSCNQLSGSIELDKLPDTIALLQIYGNKFRQQLLTIRIPKAGVRSFRIGLDNFADVRDINGNDLKKFMH